MSPVHYIGPRFVYWRLSQAGAHCGRSAEPIYHVYRTRTGGDILSRILTALASLIAKTAGLAALASGFALARVEIKFADALPKSFSYFPAMHEFKKVADDTAKGKLVVRLFPEGVLDDQRALMEATKVGSLDIAVIASQVSQQLVPEHGIFGLPFVWIKHDDYLHFLQGPIVAELGKKMEVHGLKVLTFADGGVLAVMNSKRPVRTPDDMKGLQLRVMQDPMQVDMIRAMGGIPVPMGTAEVYTAIQQGQIDGNTTGPQLLLALKNHEVAKHLTFTRHGRAAAVVVMNLKKWNVLSADQKAALEEGAKAFFKTDAAFYTSNPGTNNDETVTTLRNAGAVITEPDVESFRKATLPVVQAFKARVKSPLVDQALKDAGYQ
ncbi:MAG: TRAP transporter substrate-binding protein [Betaproteobacteria bacterium]|nr:TRAP transporter substrate-binding protein [Betaproteobacteria bacterium]